MRTNRRKLSSLFLKQNKQTKIYSFAIAINFAKCPLGISDSVFQRGIKKELRVSDKECGEFGSSEHVLRFIFAIIAALTTSYDYDVVVASL